MADATSVQVPGWGIGGYITSQITDNLTYTEWLNIFKRICCHLHCRCRKSYRSLANDINDGIDDVKVSSDASLIIQAVNAMIRKVKEVVPQLYERELRRERSSCQSCLCSIM